jgi:3-hydroxyacyl-[acyl-carrier-protein] dehydratase
MLQGDFFHVTSLDSADHTTRAMLEINPAHVIFEGHFPGQPVVPGVCMMQMVKEITEAVLGRETRLVKADQLKFLALLIPAESRQLRMELKLSARENGETGVDAQLLNESTLFFKFKGSFGPIS